MLLLESIQKPSKHAEHRVRNPAMKSCVLTHQLQPVTKPTTMRTLIIPALLVLLASHRALAGVPNSVAISTETGDLGPKIAAEVQSGLEAEILYGLTEVFSNVARVKLNLTQVSDARIIARIQECEDLPCLEDIAKSAGVDLVVQVRMQVKKTGKKGKPEYAISMVVARDAPTRDGWREKTDCQACAAGEIKHMASLLASTIAEHIKIEAQATPPPALKPPVAAVEPAPSPVAIANPPPAPPAPPEASAWFVPRYVSATALVIGAGLIGTGAYLMSIDGNASCNLAAGQTQCPHVYATGALGTGLLIGGGVATLGGLAALIFFAPSAGSAHVALGFSGTSISVRGAF